MIGANSFVAKAAIYPAVEASDHVEVVAAASNSTLPDSLAAVARPGYQSVIDDPDVEAVYIPLPNSLHREWTLRSAESGKHVLCEKPLAASMDDVAAMFAACRSAGVILAEAFMTPFHPRTTAAIEAVRNGAVGDVRSIRSEFSFTISADHADNYRWKASHGGGALWDVGIYTLWPVFELLDNPKVCHVAATGGGTGVDATTSVALATQAALATVLCSFEMPERQLLEIRGTEGTLTVNRPFTPSTTDDAYEISAADGSIERVITGGSDPYRVMLESFAQACRGTRAWPRSEEQTRTMIGKIAEILTLTPPPSAPGTTMR